MNRSPLHPVRHLPTLRRIALNACSTLDDLINFMAVCVEWQAALVSFGEATPLTRNARRRSAVAQAKRTHKRGFADARHAGSVCDWNGALHSFRQPRRQPGSSKRSRS